MDPQLRNSAGEDPPAPPAALARRRPGSCGDCLCSTHYRCPAPQRTGETTYQKQTMESLPNVPKGVLDFLTTSYDFAAGQVAIFWPVLKLRLWDLSVKCASLGVPMRVDVKTSTYDPESASYVVCTKSKFANMVNILASKSVPFALKRHGRSYLWQEKVRYMRDPEGGNQPDYAAPTAREVEIKERQDAERRLNIEKWKQKARISKPAIVDEGHIKAQLDWPKKREENQLAVAREVPLSLARMMIHRLAKASQLFRAENGKHFRAHNALFKFDEKYVGVSLQAARSLSDFEISAEVERELLKATRYCDLYHEELQMWVEENGRALNLHAIFWDLYHNDFQRSVNYYLDNIRDGNVVQALCAFSEREQMYVRWKAKKAWLKARYFLFHISMQPRFICNAWFEFAAASSGMPPNGRVYKDMMASVTLDEDVPYAELQEEAREKVDAAIKEATCNALRRKNERDERAGISFSAYFPDVEKPDHMTEEERKKHKRASAECSAPAAQKARV